MISHTLGMRAAAVYMRKNRWSFEAALFHLCGARAVERNAIFASEVGA
jgi:hypothetical protein